MRPPLHWFLPPLLLAGFVGCSNQTEWDTARIERERSSASTSSEGAAGTPAGGLTLVGGTGDLGISDFLESKACTFVVRNDANRSLELVVAEKSCACGGVEINPTTLAPRQTAEVILRWTPTFDARTDDETRVTATLQARGDANLKLALEGRGRLRPALRLHLPRGDLDFGRIDAADLRQGKELVLEVFTDQERHRGFTLSAATSSPGLRLVPAEPLPLPRSRLESLGAVAGYRLHVQCAPGLPMGSFREHIRLESSAYPGRVLELAIRGSVESGAVTVTPDAVPFPASVPLEEGYRCPPLEVILRGEPGRTLRLVKAEPSFLQVQVEPVRPNVWHVRVRVPAGEAELLKHVTKEALNDLVALGFPEGALTFESDHSLLPTFRIPVTGTRLRP